MKEFKDRNENLKNKIIELVKDDPYGLNPETLYNNIYNSTGKDESLAEIFNVPLEVLKEIREGK